MQTGHRALLTCVVLAACQGGFNYSAPDAPRTVGHRSELTVRGRRPDSLRIVSFNVEFSRDVDGAIALLSSRPQLRGADIVLLQEMTSAAAMRIAHALEMEYVYYPAIYHYGAGRDMGNAILARWPVVADAKLVLPHRSRYAGTQRIATSATVRIGTDSVRVYSVHLGTIADVSGGARRDQVDAVVEDAAPFQRAIIGGDFNSSSAPGVAANRGFDWLTRVGPSTTRLGRWDHILVRGFAAGTGNQAGTVIDSPVRSDHRPVWTTVALR